jgi:hypothetical protein
MMRIRFSPAAAAAVALTVVIAALLPRSEGNVAAALWVALRLDEKPRYTATQVSARLAQREGGYVDSMDFTDDEIVVWGWAADFIAKKPARSVQIFVNGVNAGAFAPAEDRPDVTKAVGASDASPFGFRVVVAGKAGDAVRTFAEQTDGSFAELHYPGSDK